MQTMSTIRRDFVASHLRAQLHRLRSILDKIEDEDIIDGGYTNESLKTIEVSLRQIRKVCECN